MTSFIIKHNSDQYEVQFSNAIEVSLYFAQKYSEIKKDPIFTINDLHSTSAFDAFIKILNKQPTYILEKDIHQVESLLKE